MSDASIKHQPVGSPQFETTAMNNIGGPRVPMSPNRFFKKEPTKKSLCSKISTWMNPKSISKSAKGTLPKLTPVGQKISGAICALAFVVAAVALPWATGLATGVLGLIIITGCSMGLYYVSKNEKAEIDEMTNTLNQNPEIDDSEGGRPAGDARTNSTSRRNSESQLFNSDETEYMDDLESQFHDDASYDQSQPGDMNSVPYRERIPQNMANVPARKEVRRLDFESGPDSLTPKNWFTFKRAKNRKANAPEDQSKQNKEILRQIDSNLNLQSNPDALGKDLSNLNNLMALFNNPKTNAKFFERTTSILKRDESGSKAYNNFLNQIMDLRRTLENLAECSDSEDAKNGRVELIDRCDNLLKTLDRAMGKDDKGVYKNELVRKHGTEFENARKTLENLKNAASDGNAIRNTSLDITMDSNRVENLIFRLTPHVGAFDENEVVTPELNKIRDPKTNKLNFDTAIFTKEDGELLKNLDEFPHYKTSLLTTAKDLKNMLALVSRGKEPSKDDLCALRMVAADMDGLIAEGFDHGVYSYSTAGIGGDKEVLKLQDFCQGLENILSLRIANYDAEAAKQADKDDWETEFLGNEGSKLQEMNLRELDSILENIPADVFREHGVEKHRLLADLATYKEIVELPSEDGEGRPGLKQLDSKKELAAYGDAVLQLKKDLRHLKFDAKVTKPNEDSNNEEKTNYNLNVLFKRLDFLASTNGELGEVIGKFKGNENTVGQAYRKIFGENEKIKLLLAGINEKDFSHFEEIKELGKDLELYTAMKTVGHDGQAATKKTEIQQEIAQFLRDHKDDLKPDADNKKMNTFKKLHAMLGYLGTSKITTGKNPDNIKDKILPELQKFVENCPEQRYIEENMISDHIKLESGEKLTDEQENLVAAFQRESMTTTDIREDLFVEKCGQQLTKYFEAMNNLDECIGSKGENFEALLKDVKKQAKNLAPFLPRSGAMTNEISRAIQGREEEWNAGDLLNKNIEDLNKKEPTEEKIDSASKKKMQVAVSGQTAAQAVKSALLALPKPGNDADGEKQTIKSPYMLKKAFSQMLQGGGYLNKWVPSATNEQLSDFYNNLEKPRKMAFREALFEAIDKSIIDAPKKDGTNEAADLETLLPDPSLLDFSVGFSSDGKIVTYRADGSQMILNLSDADKLDIDLQNAIISALKSQYEGEDLMNAALNIVDNIENESVAHQLLNAIVDKNIDSITGEIGQEFENYLGYLINKGKEDENFEVIKKKLEKEANDNEKEESLKNEAIQLFADKCYPPKENDGSDHSAEMKKVYDSNRNALKKFLGAHLDKIELKNMEEFVRNLNDEEVIINEEPKAEPN